MVRVYRIGLLAVAALILAGCGGGGGGGGGGSAPAAAAPSALTVSGTVLAPAGKVAMMEQGRWINRLASFFIPSSLADVTGEASVPDGTPVELVRIDPVTGVPSTPLATTSVSGGKYSFNLTSLGLDYSTTLEARIGSTTGIQMRAFVTGPNVNIDTNSEAGFEVVLAAIAAKPGSSLATMTAADLDEVVSTADMLTFAAGLSAGASVDATVTSIKSLLEARSELTSLLNTKLTAGHSDAGPGDIANYYPLDTGDSWTYSVSKNGAAPSSAEVDTVGAATTRFGATVMPVSISTTSYPLPSSGSPTLTLMNTDYYLKNDTGVVSYGNTSAPASISAAVPSFPWIRLPAETGDSEILLNLAGRYDYGQDLDGDGVNETVTAFKITNVVKGFQSVTVPSGTYNCMAVEYHALMTVLLSKSKMSVTVTDVATDYLAPNVGPVKTTESIQEADGNGNVLSTSTKELDLVAYTLGGVTLQNPVSGTEVTTVSLLDNDLAYDAKRNLLYASVPSTDPNYPNSIAVIDPDAGKITTSIPIGSEPNRLAISKGDEYLYVGLDGTGEVARIDLSTMTQDLKFPLGNATTPAFTGDQQYVKDMAVLPNNPQSIVISKMVKNWSPSFSGVSVYDNNVKRPNDIPGWGGGGYAIIPDSVAVSDDGSMVYGIDYDSSSFELSRFSVSPPGISFIDQTMNLVTTYLPARMQYHNGLLYLTDGVVIDPVKKIRLGTYQFGGLSTETDCVPDSTQPRTYCLGAPSPPGGTLLLEAFDETSFSLLSTVDTKIQVGAIGAMVRFGTTGFAVAGTTSYALYPGDHYDKIYLIQSDIAR